MKIGFSNPVSVERLILIKLNMMNEDLITGQWEIEFIKLLK